MASSTNPISSSTYYPPFSPQETPSLIDEPLTSPQISSSTSSSITPQTPGLSKAHVGAFLKLAQVVNEDRYEWTLQEIITEKVFSFIQEIKEPSFDQLSAFFSLLLLLDEKTCDNEQFKKNLTLLLGKLEKTNGALCILANCRHFFTTTLGGILAEKSESPKEKSPILKTLYISCLSYLEKFSHLMMMELKRFGGEREEEILALKEYQLRSKKKQSPSNLKIAAKKLYFPGQEHAQSLSKSIKLLEIHSKKVTGVIGNNSELPLEQVSIYQKFLFRESNAVVSNLDEYIKMAEEEIAFQENCRVSKAMDALKPQLQHIQDFGKNVLQHYKLYLENRAFLAESWPNVKALSEENESSDEEKSDIKKDDSLTFPSFTIDDFKKELPEQDEFSPIIRQCKFVLKCVQGMKAKVLFLRDIRQKMFSLLTEKLKNSSLKESSWLFLDDFEMEEPQNVAKKEKKETLVEAVSRQSPWEVFQKKLQEPIHESFLQIIPTFSYLLSKEVKKSLQEKVPSQIKADIAMQELLDHMHYGALNFSLFIKLMRDGDFYGLKVVLPMLFLDLHIQVEQWIKHDLILKTGSYPVTHSLLALAREGGFADRRFFTNFNYALQEARYPIASKEYYTNPPKALRWILFTLNLAERPDRINLEELQELVSFVFDSYQEAIQILSQPFEITNYLEACKKEVLEKLRAQEGKTFRESRKKIPALKPIEMCLEQALKLKDAKAPPEVQQSLDEASAHLEQIAASHYLKTHFGHKLFTPIHQRNQLLYNWVFEQLFVAQGIAKGIGDLRWIRHHDLTGYYYMVHPENFAPHDIRLDPFNYGRSLHYSREKRDPSEHIKNLLTTLKISRKLLKQSKASVPTKPLNLEKIDSEAIDLLQTLVKDTFGSLCDQKSLKL